MLWLSRDQRWPLRKLTSPVQTMWQLHPCSHAIQPEPSLDDVSKTIWYNQFVTNSGAPFFVVDREFVGILWAKLHIYPTSAPWVVWNIPNFSPSPHFLLIYPNNSPQVINKSIFSLHHPCSKIYVFSPDPHFAHTDPCNNSRDFNIGE